MSTAHTPFVTAGGAGAAREAGASRSRWQRVCETMWRNHLDLWRHVGRRWYAYGALLLAALAASHYLALNISDSVVHHLVWLEYGAAPKRGDLIAFRFVGHGVTQRLHGVRFLKRLAGVPGDRITVVGRDVFVNGRFMGTAPSHTPRGTPMSPIAPGVIPPGHLYIAGSDVGSLDSRYSAIGLIRAEQVLARAHPIF